MARLGKALLPSLLCFAILAWYPCSVNGQCDGKLEPVQGKYGYIKRGERCEGLYNPRLSTVGSLALVSIHIGAFPLSSGPQDTLYLQPDSAEFWDDDAPVHIQSVARSRVTPYRMDAVIDNGVTFSWPVGDVLYPCGLTVGDIGVFAWQLTDDANRYYRPLRVQNSTSETSSDKIEIVMRAPLVDIERVMLRSTLLPGGTPSQYEKRLGSVPAGECFSLFVNCGEGGLVLIEVAAKRKGQAIWLGPEKILLVVSAQ